MKISWAVVSNSSCCISVTAKPPSNDGLPLVMCCIPKKGVWVVVLGLQKSMETLLPLPPKMKKVVFTPVCLSVCKISQKVVDGSGWNFVDRFVVCQGRTDSILVTIQIWIFTKIESLSRGHTPNVSTKFHLNPSTTLWDIVLYIVFDRSLNGDESLKKIKKKLSDPDLDAGSSPKSNW